VQINRPLLTAWPHALGRCYDPKCLGTNSVMTRRIHDADFTVSVDTLAPRVPGCTNISFTSNAFSSWSVPRPTRVLRATRAKFCRLVRGAVHTHNSPESSVERVPIPSPRFDNGCCRRTRTASRVPKLVPGPYGPLYEGGRRITDRNASRKATRLTWPCCSCSSRWRTKCG
jgi:hypothetical protein